MPVTSNNKFHQGMWQIIRESIKETARRKEEKAIGKFTETNCTNFTTRVRDEKFININFNLLFLCSMEKFMRIASIII